MIFDMKSLATRKHLESGHDEVEWSRVLETAHQSLKLIGIDYSGLEQFVLASSSPEKLTVLVRLIYQYGRSHHQGNQIPDILLNLTNESPFSLSDWVDAIHYFHQWLNEHHRKIDFLSMLQYLECCVASPDAKEGGQSFAALVEDMLKVQGYEGREGYQKCEA
jgi:hypothetical protein